MATILEQYEGKQAELHTQIISSNARPEDMMLLQELNYRICVLKTMQAFCLSAPVSTDVKVLGYHYQLMSGCIHYLSTEHKFGPKVDEAGARKRDTAETALTRIIEDGAKRFASFRGTGERQYKDAVTALVNTVLPAWIQFRNTYVNI